MKRIVFCFDGTWNRIDAQYSTNVVITAESILPHARDGLSQLIYYDQGVGTEKTDRILGGVFGRGLVQNLEEAYRFLIFNYSAGDELYIFGFSRGAYTARSFAGLIGICGIPIRKHAGRVREAIERYRARSKEGASSAELNKFRSEFCPEVCISKREIEWRKSNLPEFDETKVVLAQVKYLGVWDTVGALGIPASFAWLGWVNQKHMFHDTDLSKFVSSARHAVAIDERRKDFVPTLWTNLEILNSDSGHTGDFKSAPYQQVWFPGNHGSVGGGGERRGLSDQALDWVLEGAKRCGLDFDHGTHSRIYELKPDFSEHLENSADNGVVYKAMNKLAAADRLPGPSTLDEVSLSAKRKWKLKSDLVGGKVLYRPKTLEKLAEQLDTLKLASDNLGDLLETKSNIELYVVKPGDNLSKIAKSKLGNPKFVDEIFRLNTDKLESPDQIYAGTTIRIPIQSLQNKMPIELD